MTKLYEILNEIVGDDVNKTFNQQEIDDISNKIDTAIEKKIGASDYRKLENYVVSNKDDDDLKELTECLCDEVFFLSSNLSFDGSAREEIRLGYKILMRIYNVLESSNYDAEQALLDLD